MTSLRNAVAISLQGKVDGHVLVPGDEGYDSARAVWNAMVDRRPRVIIRCASVADVATAVRFARDNDLEIGVRCGGHSVLGLAVPDNGVMIDLTPMDQVRVDPHRRRAWVEGGALLGALDQASVPHGLATTAGNVSHTGVGGLTLGGGMGWLARQYGLSCDNVVSFQIVTADGRTVRASATENPDLFWGLRGGGGNFGVVTEFEFQLHPIDGRTLAADLWFDLDDAAAVLQGWRELSAAAPREATFTAWVGELNGRPMASVGFVWVGDPAAGRRLLPPLRALGRPVDERVAEMSYVELQRMDDSAEGHALRRYWKGHYFSSLPADAIEAFLLRGTSDGRGDQLPAASLQAYGGAIADVPDADTAFSHRDTLFEFVAAARWSESEEDEARIGAARRYATSLDPFARGAYVNVLTDEGQAGVRRAYPPDKLARLTALKDIWDPDNAFHLNHNIRPSGRQAG
jgi:FAD/FMN-containing dehydrogenase